MMIKFLATFLAVASAVLADDYLHIKYRGEDCYRDCGVDAAPRVCYFKWHMEHYHVMGPACGSCGKPNGTAADCFIPQCIAADGLQRGVMSINRQIPGPAVHVCHNDTIVVDVVNLMAGTTATLHWHGLHQRETPWMDGVPFLTQCPIDFGTIFRYKFRASEPGTQFYHSHSGHHKTNGHYGGLVVRRPKAEEVNGNLYDQDLQEHLIVASDWMEDYAEMFSPGLTENENNIVPTNVLINGRGTVIDKTLNRPKTATPLAFFRVRSGQRYRFRFVNSMSHICPALLEIQRHSMQIIASDSFDLQPVTIDSLVSTSGERYDFVLNANQLSGDYWMRLRVIGRCESLRIEQYAVLSYASVANASDIALSFPTRQFPNFDRTFGRGRFLNHPNATCNDRDPKRKSLCITDLSSYEDHSDIINAKADHEFFLGFDNFRVPLGEVFGPGRYGHFMSIGSVVLVAGINNITFVSPPFSPLTQPENVDESLFCDENNKPEKCNSMAICPCIHRLKVALNSIVELIIVDESTAIGTINHPFHLHGYVMHVIAMGQHPDRIPMSVNMARRMMGQRSLPYVVNNMNPMKDTISIPSRGFTVFRFRADNPGWWMLHCHFEWHGLNGMGLALQVGETTEMPPPPDNFPKCNSYTPSV